MSCSRVAPASSSLWVGVLLQRLLSRLGTRSSRDNPCNACNAMRSAAMRDFDNRVCALWKLHRPQHKPGNQETVHRGEDDSNWKAQLATLVNTRQKGLGSWKQPHQGNRRRVEPRESSPALLAAPTAASLLGFGAAPRLFHSTATETDCGRTTKGRAMTASMRLAISDLPPALTLRRARGLCSDGGARETALVALRRMPAMPFRSRARLQAPSCTTTITWRHESNAATRASAASLGAAFLEYEYLGA